jgi:glucan-binding YG repeat protein
MQYGRQHISKGNKWVLYDRNTGVMKYGEQMDEGHWYLFDPVSGAMQYGRKLLTKGNKWVLYHRVNGTMLYGEQFDEQNWYLFDSYTGAMKYGQQGNNYYNTRTGVKE